MKEWEIDLPIRPKAQHLTSLVPVGGKSRCTLGWRGGTKRVSSVSMTSFLRVFAKSWVMGDQELKKKKAFATATTGVN